MRTRRLSSINTEELAAIKNVWQTLSDGYWLYNNDGGYDYVAVAGTDKAVSFFIKFKTDTDGSTVGMAVNLAHATQEDKVEFKIGGTGCDNYLKYRMIDDNAGFDYHGYELTKSSSGAYTLVCSTGYTGSGSVQDKVLAYYNGTDTGIVKYIHMIGTAIDDTLDASYLESFNSTGVIGFSQCTVPTVGILDGTTNPYAFPSGCDATTTAPSIAGDIPSFTYGDSGTTTYTTNYADYPTFPAIK